MRYLLLFLVILLGVILWRRAVRNAMPPVDPEAPSNEGTMVQCRVCGVYFPQEDSLESGAFHYCSEEHRKKDVAG